MSQAIFGSSANSLTCAISGLSPIPDPVVTPSGRICSKRLLLSKLVETNGRDPFGESVLDESQLIEIRVPFADASVVPPRLAGSIDSIPSILTTLQSEYDSLVLELFDTRKALEETRRELSLALYQNDAAVRVIARVLTERDLARSEVGRLSTSPPITGSSNTKKRRVEDEVETNARGDEPKQPNVVEMDAEDSVPDDANTDKSAAVTIPVEDYECMSRKREELSSERKLLSKKAKNEGDQYATLETIQSWECIQKKSWHKTSAKPGILDLAGSLSGHSGKGFIVTCGRDKQLVVYDIPKETVYRTIALKWLPTCLDYYHDPKNDNKLICLSNEDGLVCTYSGDDFSSSAYISAVGHQDHVVGITIHPTGRHIFISTKLGVIILLSMSADGMSLSKIASISDTTLSDGVEYTCHALHPDGLLLASGRSDGKICLWDLHSSKLASTLEVSENTQITALTFSENGYHMASGTSAGDVAVWDLRKMKIVDSTQSTSQVHRLRFCPLGKYLAFGSSCGELSVGAVKDLDKKVVLAPSLAGGGLVNGLIWSDHAQSLISCTDSERGVMFWGVPAKQA